MAATKIDVDEEALAEVMRLSGAKSKQATVNLALREYVALHQRIAELDQPVSKKGQLPQD